MKRLLISSILVCSAVCAGAQTMYDALTFSQNDYLGTARSMGMGNAMTAVGGDLGSIGINPAGSAVARYSQFTLTPNLTVSSSNASWSAYPVGGSDIYTGKNATSLTRFSLPNIGLTFNFDTGNNSGLVGVTYGVIFNATNNYTGKMLGGGMNDKTSYLGSMAVGADGCDVDIMNGFMDNKGNKIDQADYAYFNTNYPFNAIVNAQAGAISTFGDPNEPDYYYRYVGATELFTDTGDVDENGNHIYNVTLGGPLDQAYGRKTTGSKYEGIFNVGFNMSNRFYFGFNIGLTGTNYNYSEYFKEAAQHTSDFELGTTDKGNAYYFKDYRSQYSYSADASGFYLKAGFLARPTDFFRIGAAIQTPTWTSVKETWRSAATINYEGMNTGYAESPAGNFSYNLRSPFRANAGVAFNIAGMALLSADYEFADYSTMKYSADDEYDANFEGVNNDIKDCMGISHMLRIGAEFKPIPELAIRAGYGLETIPEYSYMTSGNKITHKTNTNTYSVGLGYSSNGSFFADIACRLKEYADEFITPYADYLSDVSSPMIKNERSLYSISATIGWRF